MSNRQYDFNLAAQLGASQRIDATGAKLKVLSSPAGPIGVKIDGGPELQLLEGQGFSMPNGTVFRDVVVRNLQAVGNVGAVFIGSEGFEDTRITGTVSVIDGSVSKTQSGNQFWGSFARAANAAGSAVIGLSPSGGVKSVAVKSMLISSTVAGSVLVGYGTGGGTIAGVLGVTLPSKLVNSNPSTAKAIAADSAAVTPSVGEVTGFLGVSRIALQAGVPVLVPFMNPLILTGANNLTVSGQALNRDLQVVFETEEF